MDGWMDGWEARWSFDWTTVFGIKEISVQVFGDATYQL
jgi:hypothetical protein